MHFGYLLYIIDRIINETNLNYQTQEELFCLDIQTPSSWLRPSQALDCLNVWQW